MILAIDTSTKLATVALVEEAGVVAEVSLLSERSHSVVVLPMVEQMLALSGKSFDDIACIACGQGPGSFTGLRIGASVAKGLAFALDKKIVPVSSLDALAYNVLAEGYTICPMLDARKQYVYTALYQYEGGAMVRLEAAVTLAVPELIERGSAYNRPMYFVGEGAQKYRELLAAVPGAVIAAPHLSMQRAGSLGAYALAAAETLTPLSASEFAPVYMSRSQAEEDHD